MKFKKIVPDTSIIIEGFLSKRIKDKQIMTDEIIIHEAVLSELESQANKKKETGMRGLEEVEALRLLAKKNKFKLQFKGNRPGDFEIKFAKSGEIDSLIRALAGNETATLFTADIVQAKVAKAKGVSVYLYEFTQDEKKLFFEKYFDKETKYVIISENKKIVKRKGMPGNWKLANVSKNIIKQEEIRQIIEDLISVAKSRKDSFFENEKKSSFIIQIKNYKIMICRPPLSSMNEIIIQKQIQNINIDKYAVDIKIKKDLISKNKGFIIFGNLGSGKSTFMQAIANHLEKYNLNFKILENSKDITSNSVASFNSSFIPYTETQIMLMASTPDFVVFDELRFNVIEDFRLLRELRSAGISVFVSINISSLEILMNTLSEKFTPKNLVLLFDYFVQIENGKIKKTFEIETKDNKLQLLDIKSKKIVFEINL